MNKQCKACGSIMPGEAKFCQVCGGSEFFVVDPQQSTGISNNGNVNEQAYNQNQYNQQNSFNQTGWQPPVPQNQPKKKKTGLVIGIVAAVLVVLAAIGIIAEKVFQDQGYGDNSGSGNGGDYSINTGDTNDSSDESITSDETVAVAYTKGTFDGSVYVNEWADIKLALPDGFSDADSATYSSAESSNTDCGAYFMADDTMSLIYICYEKLPSFPVYDEEEYLDSAMDSIKNISGVTYEVDDAYSTTNIAGYAYATAECNFNNGYGDFVQSVYVRKIDGYMVFISAISNSADSNDALVNNITKAN